MNIKFKHNRTAEYGIALGILIYAAWSAIARLLAVNTAQGVGARLNSARPPRKTKLSAVQSLSRNPS
jgi:hypothetical protein